MTGIYLLLTGLAAFGFVPLFIILYKKNRVKKILTTGLPARATVYHVHTSFKQPTDIVHYSFYAQNITQPFTGSLTIKSGVYRTGDVLEIYYLPGNPKQNTMKGAWGSNVLVAFGIILALVILFAVFKLYQMIESGSA